MKPLDPSTLRWCARVSARYQREWRETAAKRNADNFGQGFERGMQEMARRLGEHCREHARAIEKRRTKKAGKR